MALAVGDRVYLSVNGGLLSDPPLFGRVDVIGGSAPDVIRVNWENGVNQSFDTASPARLVEVATDPNELEYLGADVNGITNELSGRVVQTWIEDPNGSATRTALILTPFGLWVILEVANIQKRV